MEGIFEYQDITAQSWLAGESTDPRIWTQQRPGYGSGNGLSHCILGNRNMPNAWVGNQCIVDLGSTLPNCVGYAWGRACYTYTLGLMMAGVIPDDDYLWKEATPWDNYFWKRGYGNLAFDPMGSWEYAQMNDEIGTGDKPQIGALIIYTGHIAFIEEVLDDGTCIISESGWGTSYWPLTRISTRAHLAPVGGDFVGFIYAPPECSFLSKYWLESEPRNTYSLPNRIWVV